MQPRAQTQTARRVLAPSSRAAARPRGCAAACPQRRRRRRGLGATRRPFVLRPQCGTRVVFCAGPRLTHLASRLPRGRHAGGCDAAAPPATTLRRSAARALGCCAVTLCSAALMRVPLQPRACHVAAGAPPQRPTAAPRDAAAAQRTRHGRGTRRGVSNDCQSYGAGCPSRPVLRHGGGWRRVAACRRCRGERRGEPSRAAVPGRLDQSARGAAPPPAAAPRIRLPAGRGAPQRHTVRARDARMQAAKLRRQRTAQPQTHSALAALLCCATRLAALRAAPRAARAARWCIAPCAMRPHRALPPLC